MTEAETTLGKLESDNKSAQDQLSKVFDPEHFDAKGEWKELDGTYITDTGGPPFPALTTHILFSSAHQLSVVNEEQSPMPRTNSVLYCITWREERRDAQVWSYQLE